MFRIESGRCATRLMAAMGALIATVTLITATQAWGGSGGIGDGTEPTDPASADEGVFPVPGRHSYGDGFGAGRDHQGQDLLAACGKAIVSAQPGRVQTVDYHAAAGNYVVVDGKGVLRDLVYSHLRDRTTLHKGERVAAGQLIGRVGDTGNASTCHLHFEIWSNPGYYEGGDAINPTPTLKAWDRAKRRD